MSTYSLQTRNIFSTWFNLFFLCILGSYLVYIEFFQDTQISQDRSILLTNPLQDQDLANLKLIEFKNRIGQFSIKNENNNWLMYTPNNIPANLNTLNGIVAELKNLSITTIHEYEQINIKSFSLDKPVIEIKLYQKDNEVKHVKFGILNRINNTTYMSVSGNNIIYQVNIFKKAFETFELSDFIDSKVFSIDIAGIKRFSLYSGQQADARNVLENSNEAWISKNFKLISNSNTESKIDSILNIPTHMIIDETNEEVKTFIQNYLDSPLYRISILTKDGQTLTYKVSTLTKAIPELKIKKREYFIMSASDRPYPFLINKKYLDRFIIKYTDLK